MANCHHRPLLTLTLICVLPCLIAIAVPCLWVQTQNLIPSSFLLQQVEELPLRLPRHGFPPGAASLRGRRPYQEDRLFCSAGFHLPSQSSLILDAGLYGVFDGHLGDTASDFAARSIKDRFLHHISQAFKAGNLSSIVAGMPWFEASLLNAISDIDAAFGKVAATHGVKSGSTACVAFQVRDQIIVANVGDSKAFLCSSCKAGKQRSDEHLLAADTKNITTLRSSRRARNRMSGKAAFHHSEGLCVEELSSDHRPDRPDEKVRIEASGGFVTGGLLPRVNGQLAVSRSIGDIDLRQYGVISKPELSGWHQISDGDKFLVLASDGIFEKLSPQQVCNVLHAIGSGQDIMTIMDALEEDSSGVIALPAGGSSTIEDVDMLVSDSHSSETSHIATVETCFGEDSSITMSMPYLKDAAAQIMAQILVELAFRSGSLDNLSAIVVPLRALRL